MKHLIILMVYSSGKIFLAEEISEKKREFPNKFLLPHLNVASIDADLDDLRDSFFRVISGETLNVQRAYFLRHCTSVRADQLQQRRQCSSNNNNFKPLNK